MRGRRVLMESFVSHGVRHIFGNPGTTETPLLDSLPAFPQLEYIMALHEGVAVSAASFYAQASGRVTVANLHVAPGLGNGIGSLYGALKANSPVVVTAGQQDTRMRLKNPVLGHDLVAMAAPVTKWSVQIERADEIAPIMRRAFKVATDGPQGPVFVALPIDVLEQETAVDASAPDNLWRSTRPDPAGVEALAALLLKSKKPAIIAGDDVARSGGEQALVALGGSDRRHRVVRRAAASRALPDQPSELPPVAARRRPAGAQGARRYRSRAADRRAVLRGHLVCAGRPHSRRRARAADRSLCRTPRAQQPARCRHRRRHRHQPPRLTEALRAKANADFKQAAQSRNAALAELQASEKEAYRARVEKSWNREPNSMPRVTAELRRGLPDNVVIVDESITASLDLARAFDYRGFGDYFGGRGGGIGQGLAGAIGVKVAMPDRPVVAVSGDGSAMYASSRCGPPRTTSSRSCSWCLRTASTASSSTMWMSGARISKPAPSIPIKTWTSPAPRSTSCTSQPAWASRPSGSRRPMTSPDGRKGRCRESAVSRRDRDRGQALAALPEPTASEAWVNFPTYSASSAQRQPA